MRCRVDGKAMSPASLLKALNDMGRDNGIGRLDLVENRFVGMKSRGVYETPGGTILLAAHRAIESITLDRGAAHLKDELMPRYAELIYNGFWFSPERAMLQALIDKSQEHVEGEVTLELYKGNVIVTGRASDKSLYSSTLVTFEDDKGAYDQKDAEGFIRLNALRLRTLGMRDQEQVASFPLFGRALLRPRPALAGRGQDGLSSMHGWVRGCTNGNAPHPCLPCASPSCPLPAKSGERAQ